MPNYSIMTFLICQARFPIATLNEPLAQAAKKILTSYPLPASWVPSTRTLTIQHAIMTMLGSHFKYLFNRIHESGVLMSVQLKKILILNWFTLWEMLILHHNSWSQSCHISEMVNTAGKNNALGNFWCDSFYNTNWKKKFTWMWEK